MSNIGGLLGKLKDSKLFDLVGVVAAETPFGKIGRIIKGASVILGTDDNPEAVDAALANATPEQRAALMELAVRERESDNETTRALSADARGVHQVDMGSDSWMAKNIRPIVLAVTLSAYLVLVFIVTFLLPLDRTELAIAILAGVSGLLTAQVGFYFGGRTGEKVTTMLRRPR
jgi:hypothetical protein